ncbi:recombinase family protein [Bradyrhizobium arachidis]|uniref:recombinase family protein n=1 Tax=Bradyrhizobium arachidis TaxID=858423 RepID=UPI002163613E|nr:recombinase family protein [Bradyrhizobium arachidis]
MNGNLERRAGILQNELYAGRLDWNKVGMVKDPDSGKRLSRPNPNSEWQVAGVPHLAIVNPGYSQLLSNAKKRAVTPTPAINVGLLECCLVCSVAAHAPRAWQPMGETNQGAFVFATRLQRRAAHVLTRRLSI